MAPRLQGRTNPGIVEDTLGVLGRLLRERPEFAFATWEAIVNRAGRDVKPGELRTKLPQKKVRADAQKTA